MLREKKKRKERKIKLKKVPISHPEGCRSVLCGVLPGYWFTLLAFFFFFFFFFFFSL